jgi:uncharacterized protein DUF5681
MTDQDNSNRPFEVGYGKPPKQTQFVKGKSGNPRGRGKGVRNFATEIQDELNTRVPITENGRRTKITKRKAVAKQLVNKAASGDPKAIPVLLNESRLHEAGSAATTPGPEVLCRPEDQPVMANIVKRIREAEIPSPQALPEPSTDNPSIQRPPAAAARAAWRSSLLAAAPRPVSRAARVAWLPLSKAAD